MLRCVNLNDLSFTLIELRRSEFGGLTRFFYISDRVNHVIWLHLSSYGARIYKWRSDCEDRARKRLITWRTRTGFACARAALADPA